MNLQAAIQGQQRQCPLCGSSRHVRFADANIQQSKLSRFSFSSRKQPEFMRLHLVRCSRCDLVYAPTPPSEAFLKLAYQQAAYDSQVEACHAARSYAAALAKPLQRWQRRGAAIEVGAGSGAFLPWLQQQGFHPVLGLEPSAAAIDAAPPQLRSLLQQGMYAAPQLRLPRLGLVCSFMTLEHLSDPRALVHDAYRALMPGGMIAVVVHNWRAPINRLLAMASPIMDIEHLQLFSPRSLQALLAGAGFDRISQHEIRNHYPLSYWLRLAPLPVVVKDRLLCWLRHLGLAALTLSLPTGNRLAIGYKPDSSSS